MKKLKINVLFHWLYAILMLLPFGLLVFNLLSSFESGNVITFADFISYFNFTNFTGVSDNILQVYLYCMSLFGLSGDLSLLIAQSLCYWSIVSIIWVIFDVLMYIPNLCHKLIDKAVE